MALALPSPAEDAGPVVSRSRFLLDALLGSYSQILFSHSRPVGIMLAAATSVAPVPALFGLGSILVALVFARLFSFNSESIRAGLFSYNALLVGLGIGALYEPGAAIVFLAIAAALFSVLATATLNSALGATFNLPSLTLPFLLVFYLVTAFAHNLDGVTVLPFAYSPLLQGEHLPHIVASYLKSMGALFFLPRVDSGVLVAAALLLYSRTGFVLSLLGFAVAYPLSLHMVAVPDAHLHLMMGYNLVLVSVALGGVWFVPSVYSFLFALSGVLVGAIFTLASKQLLGRFGLSVLILPFNFTVIPMLYAMRQRIRDGKPKAVDFMMGTPEQNLNYFQTRMARFGYLYYVQFSLPFLGKWVCTQGNDGDHTHKEHWRHGFDFEVQGGDGKTHRGAGKRLEDYYCHRLPVLAAADGTVVKVVDGVPDNNIGEVNTRENWGNLVLLYHGIGLYSLVAHLGRGSIKVKEGEAVRRGEQLGLCGNSGRSPTPHIHFQLQGTHRIGAPTIEAAFHETVVVEENLEELHTTAVPEEGQVVRNLEPEPELARVFSFPIGDRFVLQGEAGEGRKETIESQIDLYGNLSLKSSRSRALLFFENKDTTFTVYDYLGPPDSALGLVALALPRVPLEPGRDLTWSDHLVSRTLYPLPVRFFRDFLSPFLGLGGVKMKYRMKREGMNVVFAGASVRNGRDGVSLLKTVAEAKEGVGLVRVTVTFRGQTRTAVYLDEGKEE